MVDENFHHFGLFRTVDRSYRAINVGIFLNTLQSFLHFRLRLVHTWYESYLAFSVVSQVKKEFDDLHIS